MFKQIKTITRNAVHSIRKSFKLSAHVEPEPTQSTQLVEPEPVPEPVPELKQVVESEPVPELKQVVESEPVPELKQVVESEPVPELKQVVEPEPVPELKQVVEPEPVPELKQVVESEPVSEPEQLNPLTLSDHVFKYKPCDVDSIIRWKYAKKNDIGQLIAIIRPLYFFSECDKRCVRTYELHKDDIPRIILKIRKRPHLNIDTSDIDLYDHTWMYRMFCRLKDMIGMFQVKDYMVRVEHALDNSQIRAEYCVVHQLMKHAKYDGTNGIDSEHHIVVPVCVQLNNLEKIPESERTLFHHISYSIQPFVWRSQTLDVWFRKAQYRHEALARLCGQLAKALVYLHTYDIVHGDIKPGNTLVCISPETGADEPVLYLIDYGMSGLHDASEGTGGTKPFCAPETGNGCTQTTMKTETYNWIKNKKENDMWSFGIMFFTMMVLHKCIFYQKDYPTDFFDPETGYINPSYFNQINDEPMRDLFRRTLCPVEKRITAVEFLHAINAINKANAIN